MRKSITGKEMRSLHLFGGEEDWDADDWAASDDSVRGGKSESHLSCDEDIARFHGNLDIKTLGGAGFASQRTKGDLELDLSDYAGIQLCIAKGDKKRYTLVLKDDLLPPDAKSGRDRATISWECDFVLPPEDEPDDSHEKSIFIPWNAFVPTYRGKPKKDVEPLDRKNIKRLSIMIRSFFGAQEGDFSLSIQSISALCETPSPLDIQKSGLSKIVDVRRLEDGNAMTDQERNPPAFWRRLDSPLTRHRGVAWAVIGATTMLLLYFRCRSETLSR